MGFLPPNNASGDGQAFVSFVANLLPPPAGNQPPGDAFAASTGTVVRNSANIGFDPAEPQTTNEVDNTVDGDEPASTTTAAGFLTPEHGSVIQLDWSGSDVGSGVKDYSIFMRRGTGPFVPLLVDTTETSTLVIADPGVNYSFYSLARDNTHNVEPAPESPDVTVLTPGDCNGNGIDDAEDIASGFSQDCQPNGIPDECDLLANVEEDCNENGTPDSCDVSSGSSNDVDGNQVPDECESVGDPFCYGDGSSAPCPCANTGGFEEGCAHSGGHGMVIRGTGTTRISADDLRMTAAGVPPVNTGIFFVGNGVQAPLALFDGLSCVGGDQTRRFRPIS